MLDKSFVEVTNNIKNEITKTRLEIMVNANNKLVNLYYNIGKTLEENSRWGNKFIDNVARELKIAFPNLKGFSVRNLKYMKAFYNEYKDDDEFVQLVAQIPWKHNITLMQKVKDDNDNPSIGIILCSSKNNQIVDYTLKYINKPVGVSEYKIFNELPDNLLKDFPTEDELNMYMDIDEE